MADRYIYLAPDKDRLCQGDILWRHPNLIKLLAEVHPHYANHPSYKYFVVVTQTCDLVCRDGRPPSSPYITIAAARPVEEAIQREAKKHQDWWETPSGLLDFKEFDQMVLFAESLLNNNITNYFYLHEDLPLVSGQHCVFLSLTITLKVDHHEICRKAKVAEIQEVFRAKLGWLLGNIYSRVGTPDWDGHYGKNDSRKKASQLIKDNFSPISKKIKKKAIKELAEKRDLKSYSPEEIFEQIKNTNIASRSKRFSDRLAELFKEEIKLVEPIGGRLIQDMSKDDKFSAQIEKALVEHDPDEAQNTINAITRALSTHLQSYLTEQSFPGREKLACRIMEKIKQDSIIKNTLVPEN